MKIRLRGGLEIELAKKGRRFFGIGGVWAQGVPLRNGSQPVRPCCATPEGIGYAEFRDPEVRRENGRLVVRAKAIGRWQTTSERMVSHWWLTRVPAEYLHPGEEFVDWMEWIFEPKTLRIEGTEFDGFVLRYRFLSEAGRKVRRLEEAATWEIGGSCTGNILIQRCYYTPYKHEVDLTRETAWDSGGRSPGAVCGEWAFQYALRWGGSISSFDFLANEQGTLIRGYERPAYIRTWECKLAGDDRFATFDEHFDTLSSDFSTVGTFVGFSPAKTGRTRTDIRNLWTAVYDHFRDEARQYAGAKPMPMLPIMSTDWLQGTPGRVLYEYADKFLRRIAALGYRVVFLGPVWEADVTAKGRNSCGIYEWRVAQGLGGLDGLRYYVNTAHELGLLVIAWCGGLYIGAQHINPFFTDHPERVAWRALYGNGRQFGSGYDCATSFNLRIPEAYAYVRDRCRGILEESELDGLFWDSHVDAWFEPIDGRDGLFTPMLEEAIHLTVEIQSMCRYFCCESQSPFAQIQVGNGIAGLSVMDGCEYANYDRYFSLEDAIQRHIQEADFAARYYRHFAYGGGLRFQWRALDAIEANPALFDGIRQANLDITAAKPHMGKRRLLEGDPGVEWTSSDGRNQVYFSFAQGSFSPRIRPIEVRCLTTGQPVAIQQDGRFETLPHHTYLVMS